MTAPALATVTDYDALIDALRARQTALGITDATLEALTGLQSGYVGKIFGAHRSRALGRLSLGLILQGLAVKITVIEDPAGAAQMAERWEKRERPACMLTAAQHPPIEFKLTHRHMKKIAKKGVKARMKKMTCAQRRRVAKQAAKARWKRKASAQAPAPLAGQPIGAGL